MGYLSVEKPFLWVRTYFETHSFVEVSRLFREPFPGTEPPNKTIIFRNVKKYLDHGTSLNICSEKSGRRKTGRSQENIDLVQETLEENPTTITSRMNGLGLPKSTFQRIVLIDLRWHHYLMQKHHELKVGDYARRMAFSEWLLERNRDNHFLHNLIIGD